MKIYRGVRTPTGCVVTVELDGLRRRLRSRTDLRNHSPAGFEWGYPGSGPAQLSLALLADHLGDDELALAYYQEFKRDVVGMLSADEWTMPEETIALWWRRGSLGDRPGSPPEPVPGTGGR